MAGGPGYIIGNALAEAIPKLMGPPMSWNEDKAIGIGVFRAKNNGLPVRHIYLHMDDGETDTLPFTGDWRDYPFFAQHQLSSTSIECLFQLELNKSGSVDHCYQFTPWLRELYESGWEILQQTLKWHGLFGWPVSFGTSPFQVDKVSSFSLSSCECPIKRPWKATTPWEKNGKHPTAASNVFLRQAVELQLINWVHATLDV